MVQNRVTHHIYTSSQLHLDPLYTNNTDLDSEFGNQTWGPTLDPPVTLTTTSAVSTTETTTVTSTPETTTSITTTTHNNNIPFHKPTFNSIYFYHLFKYVSSNHYTKNS